MYIIYIYIYIIGIYAMCIFLFRSDVNLTEVQETMHTSETSLRNKVEKQTKEIFKNFILSSQCWI